VSLVKHCKKILEQNLLKSDENLLIATPYKYDVELTRAFLGAASEMGAGSAHMAVGPKLEGNVMTSGLTPFHWSTYAAADLLITIADYPARADLPMPFTDYVLRVGNHKFRTDHESLNRKGSKTRWIYLMMPVHLQMTYFPTKERAERTLEGAKIMHKTKEISITSKAGSDFTVKKVGRPGHAQYGIADYPGRWDNFGYGCVACGPEEYTAEGTIVLEPGDIIPDLKPFSILTEQIKLTFRGGYVTKVQGDILAKRFSAFLASFGEKETYGTSHVGYGTHEKATLGQATAEDVANYHHNASGSTLFSLGVNYGHGLGGPGTKYSGLGDTQRKAKSHTHFALFKQSFFCDGEKVVEDGKLLLK
jgi:2,5-dihydroxypyridine 5,6-dioxygenase